jgi:hypothetical protein
VHEQINGDRAPNIDSFNGNVSWPALATNGHLNPA